jgi:MFS family permease
MFNTFPTFNNKNVAFYYLLTFFMNGWFILPNWVFYYSQFISIPQVGFIDGISKLVAVFLEVPSGAVSDLLGKKKTLIFGNASLILCCLVLMNATNFLWLMIGNICMFIGFAFVSGAKEAFLYDTLIDIKKETHYDEVLGKVNSIATFVTVLSIFTGGLLYRFNPKFTFLAWLLFSSISILLLIFMKEPKADEEHLSYSAYVVKLKTGVQSIFTRPIFSFVLPVLFFSMLIKTYEGVIRQNTGAYFGFSGETFGYVLALILIPTLLVSYNYNRIALILKDKTSLFFTGLYMLGFLIVYFTNNILLGAVSFLSIYIAQEITKPFIISLINKNTDSKHRATAISTVSLFSEFPYMIVVIFFGSLIQIQTINYFYAFLTIVLLLYTLLHSSQPFWAFTRKSK